jgi:MFS family permease
MTDPEFRPTPDLPRSWPGRTFASLRHRNYRLYFTGQFVSLVGMWMQSAAQSWLVYDLTGSKAMLGAVGLAGSLPILLVSIYGGLLADRFPRKGIIIVTQVIAAMLALILATLVLTGSVHVWHIVVLAALLGTVAGLEMPARQAFVIEMVGRPDLMNAIALNSTVFHAARILGPAVAGLIIAAYGTGPCFLVNGLSYTAVLAALLAMRLDARTQLPPQGSLWAQSTEGFRVVARNRGVLGLLILTLTVGVFGWSYVVLLPAVARDTLEAGPGGYGLLMSSTGVGSVIGALLIASFREVRDGRVLVTASILVYSAAVSVFAATTRFDIAILALAPAGMGLTAFFSLTNTLIQASVDDNVRGRVMGVYTLVFGAMLPLGALQAGALAEAIGTAATIHIGALLVAVSAVAGLFMLPANLRR